MPTRLARGLVLLLVLAGCGDTPVDECGPGTGVECPSNDEIIAGVNLTDLFLAPSPGEISAAYDSLASGDGVRTFTEEAQIDRGGRETVTVLRGSVEGEASVFYAAVRQPPRAPGDQRQRPLVLFLGEGADLDFSSALRAFPTRESLRDDAVVVFVALRGGTLRVDGQAFQSGASEVDAFSPALSADLLALLAHVRGRAGAFNVNSERVGFIGYGTGGTIALMAGARTNADDYLLSLAAPSTFYEDSVRDAARSYLRSGSAPNPFPGLVAVLDSTVGRVRDQTLSIAEARLFLLLRSPASLVPSTPEARPLALLFVAHGNRDTVVPTGHARALDIRRREGEGVVLVTPEATHETILQDAEVLSTGAAFFCERLLPDVPNCS